MRKEGRMKTEKARKKKRGKKKLFIYFGSNRYGAFNVCGGRWGGKDKEEGEGREGEKRQQRVMTQTMGSGIKLPRSEY